MKKSLSLLMSISTLLLTGCTLYKNAHVPTVQTPHQFKFSGSGHAPCIAIEWWKNFNDPQLNQLVQLALKNNNNYLIALKNIAIAKTYVTQNYSTLFPTFNLNYAATAQKVPSPYFTEASSNEVNLQELNASVAYQLNLWNQLSNAVKQAKSSLAGTESQTLNTKITLINSIVTTYFQSKTAHDTLMNLQHQEKSAITIVNLYTIQFKSGLINASSLDDQKTQLENIQMSIATTQKQLALFQNTLAYLLGEYPENFRLTLNTPMKNIPYQNFIPKNLPSQLIINRPDVQYSYDQVLATDYAKKISIAGFLPAFNLTGNYGYAGTGLENFLTSNSNAWSAALAVAEPIINIESNLAAYRRAKFQYQSAVISYKDSVINAFTQIDNALITYQKDHEALRFYGSVLTNNQDKMRIAKAQYHSGYADYASFLTSQLMTLQSQNSVAAQRLVVITDVAQVYQNLGV